MSLSEPDNLEIHAGRERFETLLAKNLVAARISVGITQHELASAAGVSRATIAQVETGVSDPRLSTIVDLATALGIPPILLLFGIHDVQALAKLRNQADPLAIPEVQVEKMRHYLRSGMLKDRVRAAKLGATIARTANHPSPAIPVAAGILSAILPGLGTQIATILAQALAEDVATANKPSPAASQPKPAPAVRAG